MATNGRGFMRPSSGGRTPPFLIVGLLVVIGILAFNYWNLSSKNSMLTVTVSQLEAKYRSIQANKLDVEKRNVELNSQLEEAKRYRQEAQDKDMKLREAEQKAAELTDKIDNLASDLEVARNDFNTCDESLGFCHQNITKMTIDHKRELEEAHMQCNRKVDEAKSAAEQRAASLESSCQQAVNEMRLTVLHKVQQVFGTKAVLLLQQQAHLDVSGIDLSIMTGADLEQSQQVAQQNAQTQQYVTAVQQQQAPQQQYHQLGQQEREQEKLPGENQIEQQQPGQNEPEQPQLQNNLPEYHHQQQYPNLQHVSKEQQPHLQPALPAERVQVMTQQQKQVEPHDNAAAQEQQHAEPTAQHVPHESLQNVNQQHEKPDVTLMDDKNKEVAVNPGLSQSDDLIKAAQHGYSEAKQNAVEQQQDQASELQKPENQLSVINQAPVAQQGIDETVRSSEIRPKIDDTQKQDAEDAQIVSQRGEAASAPAGELVINRQVEDADKQEELPVSDQKRDQQEYVARGLDDAAPLGQADEGNNEIPQFHQYSEDGSHPHNDDDRNEAAIQQIPQEPVQV